MVRIVDDEHRDRAGGCTTEEKLGDIRWIDIVCVPVGAALNATKAAELVAQLDPRIVVPMPVCEEEAECAEALATFYHEMSAEPVVQSKLDGDGVEPPGRAVTVRLEPRGKT